MREPRPFVATPSHPLTGKRFRVRARTERELAAYLHRIDTLREDLRLGMQSADDVDRQLRRLRHGAITLARAARSYAAREDLAENTRRRILSVIAGPLEAVASDELDALDGARLAPLFDRIARTHSRSSHGVIWRTLRAIVRHAAERGWTARVPWGSWRPRARAGQEGRAPRELARSEAELARLLAAAAELDASEPIYRALEAKIAAAALLGLRQGELAGLRWYDVYPKRLTVGIRRQYGGAPVKAGDSAELDAPALLFALLERHRVRSAPADSGAPVFPSPAGGHYTRGECLSTRDLRACATRAHLDKPSSWSPHSLRDTFVNLEAQRHPGDLRRLADRTRHRSISSLVRYLRTFERARHGDAPALPPRGP